MLTKRNLANYPKRGEIFTANLSPSFGRKMHKKRPVLVISNNMLNQTLPTVVIIPFSSIVPTYIGPDVVKFSSQKGLDRPSALIINQIRAIDKERLIKRLGEITKEKLLEVEAALGVVLSLYSN